MQYFGSNIVESVAESWMEAKLSWVEVGEAGWRLKQAEWRWMEEDGAGWRWMEVGARFSNTQLPIASLFDKFFFTLKCISGSDRCRLQRQY